MPERGEGVTVYGYGRVSLTESSIVEEWYILAKDLAHIRQL